MGATTKLQVSEHPTAERSRSLARETAVLGLASRGFRLFPVKDRGKLPLITQWPAKATSDPETLRSWMKQYAGCNWGLACGIDSGVFVLDFDGAEGEAAIRGMSERHGNDWTRTLSVKTVRGVHFYFQHPVDVATRNSV